MIKIVCLGTTTYKMEGKSFDVEYTVVLKDGQLPTVKKSKLGLKIGEVLNVEELFYNEKGVITLFK